MLLGRCGRRTRSGGGGEGFLVVVLRVGIPGHAVLLLPDGYGLHVKRVTREQIRRAECVEIAVIDQRACEVREGVSRRGAFSLMALAACRRPVDPDFRVVTLFADARGTILALPGWSLMADAAPALASHQMSAGVVGVATERSAFVRSTLASCARSRRWRRCSLRRWRLAYRARIQHAP